MTGTGTGASTPADARRERNVEAVLRAFDAVNRGDADAQCDEYAEDAVMEFPFPITDPPTRLEGREAIRALLANAFTKVRMTLEVTEIHRCVDPDRLVVEFSSTGTLTRTGATYANRYINVFGFSDGRIRLHREYLDPGPAAAFSDQ